MSISVQDSRILWCKSAGCCAFPGCYKGLIPHSRKGGHILIGEMAHIIGRKEGAARSAQNAPPDDSYENHILLCPTHHALVDKAEAQYSVETLRKWKSDWEAEVERRVLQASLVSNHSLMENRLWSYFNFHVILDLYKSRHPGAPLPPSFEPLKAAGIVDSAGFPIEGSVGSEHRPTVFDSFQNHLARALQQSYSDLVDDVVKSSTPIGLDALWGVRRLQAALYDGAFAFVHHGFYFRKLEAKGDCELRLAHFRSKKVELQFEVNTWNMYGSSSVNLHFASRSRTAALLLIRSCLPSKSGKTKLEVKATPVALGTGFWSQSDNTPNVGLDPLDPSETE